MKVHLLRLLPTSYWSDSWLDESKAEEMSETNEFIFVTFYSIWTSQQGGNVSAEYASASLLFLSQLWING
jgi:hypothetical protein